MGLFLSRKNTQKGGRGGRAGKGSGKHARSSKQAQSTQWQPHHTLQALKLAGFILLLLALVGGWVFGKAALTQYVSKYHAHEITAEDVALAEPPSWLSQGTRYRLKRRVASLMGTDPLEREQLHRAARNLLQDPVIRDGQVKRVSGGRLQIKADYRRPVAIIEARDGYHLVGPKGTRLSLNPYYHHQVKPLGLPLILQVESAPPRRPGQRWQGESVQAALSVIRLLDQQSYFDQIRAVDVSQRDDRGRLRLMLHTANGRIAWGFPPGKERAIEPKAAVKVERLRQLAKRHRGRIDAGGQWVSIYGPTIQKREPAVRSARSDALPQPSRRD
jgi:hypothetical protein